MLNNQRVLVVDDDKNICEIVRLYLDMEGFEVVIANDGRRPSICSSKRLPLLWF